MEVINLKEKEEWEDIISDNSRNTELIIFKHSPICHISHSVATALDDWSASLDGKNDLRILKVNVIDSKPLSEKISKDLNIWHQSPQIIWLDKNRNVKHHASHFEITEEKLNKYL